MKKTGFFLFIFLISASLHLLKSQTNYPDSSQIRAFDEFNLDHAYSVYWNERTGTPGAIFSLSGQNLQRYTDSKPISTEQAVFHFLQELQFVYKLGADGHELKLDKIRRQDGIAHITLQQYFRDIPIIGAKLQVHIDEMTKTLHMLNGHYHSDVQLQNMPEDQTDAIIEKKDAIASAVSDLNIDLSELQQPQVRLVVLSIEQGYFLCYEIDLWLKNHSDGKKYYIDAATSAIIHKEDLVHSFNGQGRVYYKDPRYAYETKTLYRLHGSGTSLSGSYVRSYNDDTSEATSSNATYIYDPNDTHFDEVNVYYHGDRIASYWSGLSFSGLGYQMPMIVHAYSNWDNAAFYPSEKKIRFGDGHTEFNDLAKKDDVIYHEFTHAVSNKIGLSYVTSGNNESGAMNEGYSDYFAASKTSDSRIGEWVTKTTSTGDLRRLNTSKSQWNYNNRNNSGSMYYNHLNNYNNGRHYVWGMIWSGALWDLRNELGSYTADRLIYQGLEYVNGNATMHQGRAGILQADQALYGSSHKRDIQNTFAARGVGNYALAVEILGPGFLDPKTTGNYTANATGESGNYSYEWRYRHNGTGSWSTVFATVQTIEWTIGYNDVEFQVKVISGSDSQYDTKYVVSDEILPKAFQENAHSQIPTEFALQQNYPNPFNPETKIQFALPYAEYVQLIIYDMLGREVRRVVDKEMNAGYHSILWNGKDNKGEQVASGVYVYKIIAGEFVVNKKLTLLQ